MSGTTRFSTAWAMPSRWTFEIAPVRGFLERWLRKAAEAARDELLRLHGNLCDEDCDSIDQVVNDLSCALSAPDELAEAREIIRSLLPPKWILRLSDGLNKVVGEETEPRIERALAFLNRTEH